MTRGVTGAIAVLWLAAAAAGAQQPQPFPRPVERRPPPSSPTDETPRPQESVPEERVPEEVPVTERDVPPRQAPPTARPEPPGSRSLPAALATRPSAPSEAELGVPVHPAAQFITSYDAGRGQRYYLFGATASYGEVVSYYKRALSDGGDRVFEEPPVHMFETGRFREETMAFPPSVTVKDYTWGGSEGYLNPTPGAQPARFPTIIQIVPGPTGR